MTKLSESQPYGGDDAYSAKITTDTNPASALIHAAGNLTKDFGEYKKHMDAKERRRQEEERRRQERLANKATRDAAKAEQDEQQRDAKAAKKQEQRRKRAADARALRKQIRAEADKEKQDAADAAKAEYRRKLSAGHIMESNYKFKYRELLLSLDSANIIELYKQGMVEDSVMSKMYKYGKSIDLHLQRFSGALVTAVRQKRFVSHTGMEMLLTASQKAMPGTTKKTDGPYRLLHPLFSPNAHTENNPVVIKLKHDAKNIISTNTVNSSNSHTYSGFTTESIIAHFDNILKATGVETMVYVTIDMYNKTYAKMTSSGEDLFGGRDEKRFDAEGNLIPWSKENQYTKTRDIDFPMFFFRNFAAIFEMFRRENMKLYNELESLMQQHGIQHDTNDKPDAGDEIEEDAAGEDR